MYSTANLSDKELKEQGNRMFTLRKYEDAINCYSKAIVSNQIRQGDCNMILCNYFQDKEPRCSSLFHQ